MGALLSATAAFCAGRGSIFFDNSHDASRFVTILATSHMRAAPTGECEAKCTKLTART